MSERATKRERGDQEAVARWECHCQTPPVLLGTHDRSGTVHIKVRDRYWHIIGLVKTACPRCGTEHVLASKSPDGEQAGVSDRFGFTRS